MRSKEERKGRDEELHVIATFRGSVVLPQWYVAALFLFLVFSLASILVLWSETRTLKGKLWLLQDYTEGRIYGMPYRPPEERGP